MMNNGMDQKLIALDNTRFIYETNFSGDPARDTWGDDRRKCNVIIPTLEQAKDLTKAGYKVKNTKPRKNDDPDTFVPEYFVMVQAKYRKKDRSPMKYPPRIYLVTPGNDPVLLTEDTVGCLDQIRVKKVNTVVYPWDNDDGSKSLGIRTMYVEQDMDDDPYAEMYRQRAAEQRMDMSSDP